MDIGPHPHIGLQTVTWLLSGEVLHRDSLGSEQLIRPGQLNLMTAGRGVAHSEETLPGAPPQQHGAQLWIAQPDATRDGEAAFEHHADLPRIELAGGTVTVLVGEVAGVPSPARTDTPIVGAAIAAAGALDGDLPIDPTHEHAVVVLAGALDLAGGRVEPGELVYLGEGRDHLELRADAGTEALLLGGEPFAPALEMWWNFVGRTKDEMADARTSWEADDGRFGPVASTLGRIPAPPLH
jgi:redox-sensitive bicupin YhaK (pirin superfamily)